VLLGALVPNSYLTPASTYFKCARFILIFRSTYCVYSAEVSTRCLGSRFLSFSSEADRWHLGAVGAPDTVRCTPDSPVPPPDRWLDHVSRADRAADRWPGLSRAARGAPPPGPAPPPDSPVHPDRADNMEPYTFYFLARAEQTY
jgi:hypothetical protein